ncbi:uncharacterized protein LOC130687741 [Daphnia carinata]|uniref:uncharacterized protein LOC130687741 n=1 Tax=Daphnia carinata TaxID=120202 RepID=UPI00257965C5|nr:uncharacterized protein LOC130687741 [Daphnia carinata]
MSQSSHPLGLFITSSSRSNKMNTVLLVIGLTYALAAPAPEPYVVSRSPAIQFSRTNTEILGQISQHNDDGSYTFGYESADGSFRVENRDIDGFVTGKYGYIDPNGEVQEFEYVAGSTNGQSLGYQVRGTSLPEANRAKEFPIMYPSASSVDQRNRDYAYLSVDDDRDGFPDSIFDGSLGVRDKGQPNIVRVTTAPVQTSLENPSSILRVVKPGKVSSQQPSVVRLGPSSQTSFTNPSNAGQRPSVVRVTSSDQSSYRETSNNVRLVNPATISNQKQVVRLTSPKKTVIQPTRVSGGNYQVIKQNRQRQPKVVSTASSNPFYPNYGVQRFVSRPPAFSNVRINPLLSGQATTVRDNFGRWIVRGNSNKFVPSIPTVFIDDDDLDDLNDFDDDFDDIFDDDDTFLVDSSSLLG